MPIIKPEDQHNEAVIMDTEPSTDDPRDRGDTSLISSKADTSSLCSTPPTVRIGDLLGNGNDSSLEYVSRSELNDEKYADAGSIFSSYSELGSLQSLQSADARSSDYVTVNSSLKSSQDAEAKVVDDSFDLQDSDNVNKLQTQTLTERFATSNETLQEVASISEETVSIGGDEAKVLPDAVPTKREIGDGDADTSEIPDEEDSEWLDILGSGDLMKKVLKKGEGKDTRPDRGYLVTVNLTGQLDNGNVVEELNNFRFTIGDAEVVQGLDLALPLMEKGEISDVIVKSRFAYGSLGRKPDIPQDATLTYHIEVLDVEDEPDIEHMSLVDRMAVGDRKREKGNFWYNRGEYSQGLVCYRKSLEYLEDENQNFSAPADELQKLLELRLKLHSNVAACQMKLEAYDAAMKSIDCVIRVQPENVKAIFRKAKILGAQGNLKESITCMKKVVELEPETKLFQLELAHLLEKKKTQTSSEREMYRRMLGQKQKETEKKSSKGSSSFTIWGSILGSIAAVLVGIFVYRHYNSGW